VFCAQTARDNLCSAEFGPAKVRKCIAEGIFDLGPDMRTFPTKGGFSDLDYGLNSAAPSAPKTGHPLFAKAIPMCRFPQSGLVPKPQYYLLFESWKAGGR